MTIETSTTQQERRLAEKLASIDPHIPLTVEQIATLQTDFAKMREVIESPRYDGSEENFFRIAQYFGLDNHEFDRRYLIFEKIRENYGRLKEYNFDAVWFSHDWYREEDFDRQFYPHYYLELKQNPTLIKPYIKKLLQQGRYSRSLHNEYDETNPASYVNFLHLGSEDVDFAKKLEDAIVAILQEVKNTSIPRYKARIPRKRYQNHMENWFTNCPPQRLIEELKLDSKILTPIQQALKNKILQQGTSRFKDFPQNLQNQILQYFDKNFNLEMSGIDATPSLNILVACLEIICMRGNSNNGFAQAHSTLVELSRSEIITNNEPFELNYYPVNLPQLVERALIAVSKK